MTEAGTESRCACPAVPRSPEPLDSSQSMDCARQGSDWYLGEDILWSRQGLLSSDDRISTTGLYPKLFTSSFKIFHGVPATVQKGS